MIVIVLLDFLSIIKLNKFGGEQCLGHFMRDKHII